jgi:hypothetical protein
MSVVTTPGTRPGRGPTLRSYLGALVVLFHASRCFPRS